MDSEDFPEAFCLGDCGFRRGQPRSPERSQIVVEGRPAIPPPQWNALCLAVSGGASLQLRTKRILAATLFAITWIASVAFGMRVLFHYENTPGRVGALSQAWPAAQIERATDRPTLVMLAHPHCPCTAASVGELAQIMARLEGRVAAYVLFVKPKGAGRDWEDTDLRRSAEAIPGVKVVFDLRWRGGEAALARRHPVTQSYLERMDGCFSAAESPHHEDMPGIMPGRARLLPW